MDIFTKHVIQFSHTVYQHDKAVKGYWEQDLEPAWRPCLEATNGALLDTNPLEVLGLEKRTFSGPNFGRDFPFPLRRQMEGVWFLEAGIPNFRPPSPWKPRHHWKQCTTPWTPYND